ncbi:MAG: hypothetical protein KatS3mg020_0114 [Fimbriimonadales bacterium]|nr:MAG: hypothetical protein KatS3mg020_0114 [Fimbriimonadales bacterium]
MPEQVDSLGNPDLTIGELRLWVHGREFPNSTDYPAKQDSDGAFAFANTLQP